MHEWCPWIWILGGTLVTPPPKPAGFDVLFHVCWCAAALLFVFIFPLQGVTPWARWHLRRLAVTTSAAGWHLILVTSAESAFACMHFFPLLLMLHEIGRQLLLLEMEELELMLLLRQSRQQKVDKVPKIAKFFPETLPPAVCATLKIFC